MRYFHVIEGWFNENGNLEYINHFCTEDEIEKLMIEITNNGHHYSPEPISKEEYEVIQKEGKLA